LGLQSPSNKASAILRNPGGDWGIVEQPMDAQLPNARIKALIERRKWSNAHKEAALIANAAAWGIAR
jgi:hypothetical protein